MYKIIIPVFLVLAGCEQHTQDRRSIEFEPIYPQEMSTDTAVNKSGTIFNAANGNLFSMETKAQVCLLYTSDAADE